jgi:hypothetical protein
MLPQLSHRSKNFALRSETLDASDDQMGLHVERVANSRVDGNKPLSRFGWFDGSIERTRHGVCHGMGNPVAPRARLVLFAVIQAVVSHREMSRLLRNDSPRSIGIALALGAASSSCSYAAVAITRSIFRKGANFTVALAFEMASTNLALKLSII